MKTTVKVINIIIAIAFALQLLTAFDNNGYPETIGIAPLYLTDVLIPFFYIIGPIIITIAFFYQQAKEYLSPAIMFLFATGFIYLGYLNYPTVKQENIFPHLKRLEWEIGSYKEAMNSLEKDEYFEYHLHRLKELQMLQRMYADQYSFLERSIHLEDPRRFRMTTLFGLLGILLLVNCFNQYRKINEVKRQKAMNNSFHTLTPKQ
ncbi:hypothetical protein [Cesiribacter sp. SM1]|uniref:hypothetical protein n=1 Tax=Cesiribacter sp. SM1 TaxID=2861196 RepID=UPI001CD20D93|nr:hypothetical protein [Cesiribacter sp. SM1]